MMSKPTPLEEALHHLRPLSAVELKAAREELRMKMQYIHCHEASDKYLNDVSPKQQVVLREAVVQAR